MKKVFKAISNGIFKRKIIVPFIALALIITAAVNVYASTYIGNARSHKLHYSWCRYVDRMNDSNKVYFNDRSEAIAEGYVPCKVCRP